MRRNRWSKKRIKAFNRNRYLLKRYHITSEDYEAMVKLQNGCGICGKIYIKKKYRIDHDHKTRKIRGLLCDKCNRGLGFFGDNISGLQKVLTYLKKNKSS